MTENEVIIESMKTRRHEVLKKLVEYEKELESLDYSIAKLSGEPVASTNANKILHPLTS